mmetsp:Transcript_36255/g.58223  ORF Transcript_36255/g.58223 Transcript_36255/m.58223 type:complete len:441 (-) Transcript_36255:111-1433(-)
MLRVHCSAVNKLLRHQIRDVASQVRAVCPRTEKPWDHSSNSESPRPDEAYSLVLQYFVKLLVQEAEFVAHVFIPTASSDNVDPAESISGSIKNDQVAGGACVRMKYISEIQLLLEGFQHESFKLADWVISLSPMLCVPMLGATGRALAWTGEVTGDPLCAVLIACQERIQQHLFTFLDDNYLTKDDRQSSETGGRTMAEAFGLVKSDCIVIKEVSLLPLLVSQFESLMHHESSSSSGLMDEVSSTSSSVNTAYTRLLESTFQSIERAAQADAKRADRIKLLNFSQLEDALKKPASCGPHVLGEYLKRAGDECKHACNIYASKTAEKEFGGLLEVALHIKLVLDSGVPSSELPSHPGCDRDAVGKVLIRFGSTNARSFQALHKRVKRHLSALPLHLVRRIWTECVEFVLGWLVYLQSVHQSDKTADSSTISQLRDFCSALT